MHDENYFALELLQILKLLQDMGLEQNASTWLRTPMAIHNGQTPLELLNAGQGQDLILRLQSLAAGETGG